MSAIPKVLALSAGSALVALAPATAFAAGTPQLAAQLSVQDVSWMRTTATANISEIQSGRLAEARGSLPAVRELGAHYVMDHTKALAQLQALAAKLGVTLPSGPTAPQRSELASLISARGGAFDALYAADAVKDHRAAIAGTRQEIAQGSDAPVVDAARGVLPLLEAHLRLAEQARTQTQTQTQAHTQPHAQTMGQARLNPSSAMLPRTVAAGSGGRADTAPALPSAAPAAAIAAGAGLLTWGFRVLLRRRG